MLINQQTLTQRQQLSLIQQLRNSSIFLLIRFYLTASICTMSLQSSPSEVIANVGSFLDVPSLRNLRLTCRSLGRKAEQPFARQAYECLALELAPTSIEALQKIENEGPHNQYPKHLKVWLHEGVFRRYCCTKFKSILNRELPRDKQHEIDPEFLVDSGELVEMLAAAIERLPKLQVVEILGHCPEPPDLCQPNSISLIRKSKLLFSKASANYPNEAPEDFVDGSENGDVQGECYKITFTALARSRASASAQTTHDSLKAMTCWGLHFDALLNLGSFLPYIDLTFLSHLESMSLQFPGIRLADTPDWAISDTCRAFNALLVANPQLRHLGLSFGLPKVRSAWNFGINQAWNWALVKTMAKVVPTNLLPMLESLHLAGLCICTEYLAKFLYARRESFRTLWLSRCFLQLSVRDLLDLVQRDNRLDVCLVRGDAWTRLRTDLDKLPRLEGVKLDQLTLGKCVATGFLEGESLRQVLNGEKQLGVDMVEGVRVLPPNQR